jgi:hypothetical protein
MLLHQFRIVIAVNKSDEKGNAIKLMSSGLVVGHDTQEDAEVAISIFRGAVATLSPGEYVSYGVICLVDEVNGEVIKAYGIK